MPQVQDRRGKAGTFAARSRMEQADGQIGILQPPTRIGLVKTIDPMKVFPPGGEIAGHYPLPTMSRKLAQRIENREG